LVALNVELSLSDLLRGRFAWVNLKFLGNFLL
jgi:hypothetical protein